MKTGGVMVVLLLILTLSAWVFSTGYLTRRKGWFSAWLAVFVLSALGLLYSQHWFVFFIFWEAIAISLFSLLLAGVRRFAILYAVVQLGGAAVLLVGVIESFTFVQSPAINAFASWPFSWWLVLGFAVKAGVFGVHQWLPIVHSEAPAPVSALLSGFTVSLGIWGLMHLDLEASGSVIIWGFATSLYGAVQALRQRRIKRLLAFSTVSHMGLMVLALGAGSDTARDAVLIHVFGHGLFKGLLFLIAGYLERVYGITRVDEVERVAHLPFGTSLGFIVGLLGMSGFPFSAGYPGKYMIKAALSESGSPWVSFELIGLVGAMYSARLLIPFVRGQLKAGGLRRKPKTAERSPAPGALAMNIGVACLTLWAAAFGAIPGTLAEWILGTKIAVPAFRAVDFSIILTGMLAVWALSHWRPGVFVGEPKTDGFPSRVLVWVNQLVFLVQETHNGDIGRYLQWFLAGAAAVFLLLRLGRS